MPLKPAKLITIVAESVLKRKLSNLVVEHGASGFTISDAHGDGSRNTRRSTVHGENFRLEVIASEEVAESILNEIRTRYFDGYACIAWIADVSVIRGQKFLTSSPKKAKNGTHAGVAEPAMT